MQYIFLDNFKKEIENIRNYIKHVNLTNEIGINLRNHPVESLEEFSEHLRGFNKEKKIFEYKSIVISLYGLLEESIRIWIKEHINNIPLIIDDYKKIPEKIREKNFELSINFISSVKNNRFFHHENIDRETMLINLANCVNNQAKYSLNSEAFSPISGNLRHSKVSDAFKAMDINLSEKLKSNEIFFNFLKEKYGDNIKAKWNNLFIVIDDLVDRRNEIAHRAVIENILNINEFCDILDFIEKYGEAIFAAIEDKEIQYEVDYSCNKINSIKNLSEKGTIVCFEAENINIKKGTIIFVKTKKGNFLKSKILEIHKDEKSLQELTVINKTDVRIKIENKITEQHELFMKK